MPNQGLKLALPGKSILSNNPLDYILWSKYPPFKIIKYGNGLIDVGAGFSTTNVTVKHGLRYKPAYLAYFENDKNGRYWLDGVKLGTLSTFNSGTEEQAIVSAVDENLVFSFTNPAGAPAKKIPFYYALSDRPAFDVAAGIDRPMGYTSANAGIKLSPGFNVLNAKLYQQMVNSNCDYLKYHSTTTNKLTFNNSTNGELTKEHVHGLGYPPFFLVYGYFDNDVKEYLLPVGTVPQPFASGAFADTYRIVIDIVWAGSAFPSTVNFNYRIVIFKNNLLNML
jgi:hypothetical protein